MNAHATQLLIPWAEAASVCDEIGKCLRAAGPAACRLAGPDYVALLERLKLVAANARLAEDRRRERLEREGMIAS